VRYPQRDHYPEWFRLGSNAGWQEGKNQIPFGADFDGSSLLADSELNLDDFDDEWHHQVERLAEMAADNRQINRLPSMVDAGPGVCRSKTDHRKRRHYAGFDCRGRCQKRRVEASVAKRSNRVHSSLRITMNSKLSIDPQVLPLRLGGMPLSLPGGFTTNRWPGNDKTSHDKQREQRANKELRKDDASISESVDKFLFRG
jgi:hypothetical protein